MMSIGSTRSHAVDILHRQGVTPFRAILSSGEFATVARQTGCGPRRKRPLIPEVVGWLMMFVALQTTSMTQGLCQAWGLVRSLCPHLGLNCVSEEAFAQARGQLRLRFWRTLFGRLGQRFEQRFDAAMRWKGLRVLAADGTHVGLPVVPVLAQHFGRPKGSAGESRQPQGRLVALCSVFTGFCLGFKFVPLRFPEQTVLRHLIGRLQAKDLLLTDRGFFSLPGHVVRTAARSPLPHAYFQPGSRFRT
jgi:hypothetical protein